jgi:hypothetical protein
MVLPLIAGVLLLLTIAFLLKMFIFRMRWNLIEFMFVIVSLSVPLGFVFRANGDKFEKGASDVLALLFLSFFMMVPIIIGAWWGQYTAQRFCVATVGARILLMFCGYMYVVGAFAVPVAAWATFSAVTGVNASRFITGESVLQLWALTALMTPGLLAEARCRRLERQRGRVHKPPV